MNPMKNGSPITCLACTMKYHTLVPADAGESTGIKDSLELLVSQGNHLNTNWQFTTDVANILTLHSKVRPRVGRIGESGKLFTRTDRNSHSQKLANGKKNQQTIENDRVPEKLLFDTRQSKHPQFTSGNPAVGILLIPQFLAHTLYFFDIH